LLQLAARASDVAGVAEFARGMAASVIPELRGFGQRLLGQMALARGRWGEAHSLYRQASLATSVPALEQLAVLASLPFAPAAYELTYLAPSQLRLATLLAERREVENARRSAKLALTLWRDSDSQLRPQVEQARRIARR
jgi:hypothetical protein